MSAEDFEGPDAEDPYANPAAIVPPGETSASFDDDGAVTITRKPPEERSQVWKGRKAIENCADDKIREYPPRARSGIVDYQILGGSVSYRGGENGAKRAYLCHTHVVNDCPHTRRIARYRKEHPS